MHISVDESAMPYFGRHGAMQYFHGKPIKFRYKSWVMATPLCFCIRFRPCGGKDIIFQKYDGIGLGLSASDAAHLVNTSPNNGGSNYHIVMDNFFSSPELLRHLSSKQIAATGTVRANWIENAPLQDLGKMVKENIRCSNWCYFKRDLC